MVGSATLAAGLALTAALAWGFSDFWGGLSSRAGRPATVILWAELAGIPMALIGAVTIGGGHPTLGSMVVGTIGGTLGSLGLLLFYSAMSVGGMSILAPATALGGAAVPVIFAFVVGERPAALQVVGIVVGLASIVGLALEPSGAGDAPRFARGLGRALLAGLLFGCYFIGLHAAAGAGLWPAVSSRPLAALILAVIVRRTGAPARLATPALRLAALAGVSDALAGMFYLAASRQGLLAVVAVLASLYPAVTVILARLQLGERPRATQTIGAIAALASVALIAGS